LTRLAGRSTAMSGERDDEDIRGITFGDDAGDADDCGQEV
jgi:hypothetical protein